MAVILLCLLCLLAVVLLLAAPAPRMGAQMRALVGRWVFVRLRAAPGLEYFGRLAAVDLAGFTLETLDGRRVEYNARPAEILVVGELPGQDALQAAWAENLQQQADASGRH